MIKRNIILFAALLISASVWAQPLNRVTGPIMLEVAEEQMELGDIYNALEWYEKGYKEERDPEVAYTIAKLQYEIRDYGKAEKWYERVVTRTYRKAKNPYLPEARFNYARSLKMNGKYPEAIAEFNSFIGESDDDALKALAQNEIAGAEMVNGMEQRKDLFVEHAGKNVNSKSSEYSPVAVGSDIMYFTSIKSDEVVEVTRSGEAHLARAYSSAKQGDGWSEPVELNANINRPGFHVGNISASPDGQTLYFTRQKLEGNNLSESKLFMSNKDQGEWGPANELNGVNGDYISKQPVVGELYGGEVIFFVSNRPGGCGGFDVYYATNKGEGVFGEPVNLGNTINTASDDETPYYIDGKLYFSSEGHPGIGGFDIFSSEWNGSNWSAPENMGKGFNSSLDDLYFTIDEEGANGFLTSNRPNKDYKSLKGKTCCNDIYTVTIPEVVLDLAATTFTGGKVLTGAKVALFEIVDGARSVVDDKTNGDGNDFAFPLRADRAYEIVASKKDHQDAVVTFNTVGLVTSQSIEKKLDLKFVPPPPPPPPPPPKEEVVIIEENKPIVLENIFYDFDDDKILTEAEQDLFTILELMGQYPDMVIELSSHTDSRGNGSYNQRLSQRRASSAKNWLVAKGVAEPRIKAVGYGEAQIRNHCTNGVKCEDDEHRFNRRTEFKIISGPTSITIKKKRLKKK